MQLVTRTISFLGFVAVTGCASIGQMSNAEPLYTKMTGNDVLIANQTVQNALENVRSGMQLSWKSSVSGHSGSVTPVSTFRSKSGFYCREYDETLTIDDQTERYRDTACRDSGGLWRPVAVK